jgi:dolichol-phosphate mannosyltransferase
MTLPTGVVSVVVPVCNERDSLRALIGEIVGVFRRLPNPYEIILVDDGSVDGSWTEIVELQQSDPRVTAIRFRRNFGKASALAAGFATARGDWVLTLDADLQDDPAEIPRILDASVNLDVVSGWKQFRRDPWHKTLPSRVFNAVVSATTGVKLHDHNCGFKCYRAEVLREIRLYGELHRYIPVLAAGRGFRVGEIAVHHRPRQFGRSKYGWRRFLQGFFDLVTVRFLTTYGERPHHWFGIPGVLLLFGGAAGMAWALLGAALSGGCPIDRPLFRLSALGFLFGLQFMGLGLLAELVVANLHGGSPGYSVAERREGAPSPIS